MDIFHKLRRLIKKCSITCIKHFQSKFVKAGKSVFYNGTCTLHPLFILLIHYLEKIHSWQHHHYLQNRELKEPSMVMKFLYSKQETKNQMFNICSHKQLNIWFFVSCLECSNFIAIYGSFLKLFNVMI